MMVRTVRIVSVKSWVEISEERLAGNYKLLAKVAGGGVSVLAVVKADAYGHGIALCAPALARAGAEWLGVADAVEGAAVRAALLAEGLPSTRQPRILVMCGPLDEDADAIVQHRLTAAVWTVGQMESLAAAARLRDVGPVKVHLEVDTGMARQGVAVEDLPGVLAWLGAQKDLVLDGVMTHFAAAEVVESELTRLQRERFERAVRLVAEAGFEPKWVHAGNSSTVDNDAAEGSLCWLRELAGSVSARAMVRAGIALYGYCLPITGARCLVRDSLRPVMTWKTCVMDVRDVRAGDTVGYNATFVAKHPMRLALLPVGYSDGLRRELSATNESAGGWAMVRGQKAAIVGRVSMNLTVVDATGIAGVRVGDEAVLLGDGVTADDHARLAGTISYEILCGVRTGQRIAK